MIYIRIHIRTHVYTYQQKKINTQAHRTLINSCNLAGVTMLYIWVMGYVYLSRKLWMSESRTEYIRVTKYVYLSHDVGNRLWAHGWLPTWWPPLYLVHMRDARSKSRTKHIYRNYIKYIWEMNDHHEHYLCRCPYSWRCCIWMHYILQHTATHCNTLQHTATHCNTLQHTATHCNTLQHTGAVYECIIYSTYTNNTNCKMAKLIPYMPESRTMHI